MQLSWIELILAILTNSVFTAAILAVAGFIGRSIIERWFSRNLEKYKAELEAANAREIERLRTELKVATFQYETRFAKLHEKRAEVIAELYRLLVGSHRDLMDLALATGDSGALTESKREIWKTAYESSQALVQYLDEHRIYFPESLCGKIGDIGSEFIRLRHHWSDVDASIERDMDSETLSAYPPPERNEVLAELNKKIPIVRREIEREFRKMLGDED